MLESSLQNCRQLSSKRRMVAEVVRQGRMPPWFASPDSQLLATWDAVGGVYQMFTNLLDEPTIDKELDFIDITAVFCSQDFEKNLFIWPR